MKYQTMVGMLLALLSRRKVSAGEFAAKYSISVRTVYRYVDEMIVAGIPIDIVRGANGGICISDAYKLPRGFFTHEEYDAAVSALLAMHAQTGEPALKDAIDKLTALSKSERRLGAVAGNVLVDNGAWGGERNFSEKLTLLNRAIGAQEALYIGYTDRTGVRTERKIYPHLLVYKQNIWYAYAYCLKRNAFRLFKVGRMRTIRETEEKFERIPFTVDDLPLSFWTDGEKTVEARFRIEPDTVPFAEVWLGVDNIRREGSEIYADVVLPDDESLVGTILSAGAGLTVVEPESLRERVSREAEAIAERYRK